MYTKSNFRPNNDIIIPENYSGNAFTEITVEEVQNNTQEEISTKDEIIMESEIVSDEISDKKESPKQNHLLATFLPPKVSKPTGLFENIGLEELLIIGVLILLSQSDADDDILLLLFLLLFYK